MAPPGEVSSTETLSVDDVMFEAASWIMTAGCPDQYASDCADVGWTLKASLFGAPATTLTLLLVAEPSPVLVALSV